MQYLLKMLLIGLVFSATAMAQSGDPGSPSEDEELKITMLEALMSAPQERAFPIVAKVLAGNNSDAVKSRALFILSQINLPEAQMLLLETARKGNPELQLEAIRMLGIAGNRDALAGLGELYRSGNIEVKQQVVQAYLIAGDKKSVYELAANAQSEQDFEIAVQTLGAMGATEELRKLREQGRDPESLIQAYSIAGDYESLREMAMDESNPQMQVSAIQSLGVVGGEEIDATLLEIYRRTDKKHVKDAALHGMMISGYEKGLVELYRESGDAREKRIILQMLIALDSDAALDLIDAALGDQ